VINLFTQHIWKRRIRYLARSTREALLAEQATFVTDISSSEVTISHAISSTRHARLERRHLPNFRTTAYLTCAIKEDSLAELWNSRSKFNVSNPRHVKSIWFHDRDCAPEAKLIIHCPIKWSGVPF